MEEVSAGYTVPVISAFARRPSSKGVADLADHMHNIEAPLDTLLCMQGLIHSNERTSVCNYSNIYLPNVELVPKMVCCPLNLPGLGKETSDMTCLQHGTVACPCLALRATVVETRSKRAFRP